jgi:proliferating cell nuclear antigen
MFHAKLNEGLLIKKLIDSIKDLVSDINLDISPMGISLQAMDSSHVALVTLSLSSEGFEEYRCDKQMTLGVSISNLAKVLRCGGNDDALTLSCEEEPSKLKVKFENISKKYIFFLILNIIIINLKFFRI